MSYTPAEKQQMKSGLVTTLISSVFYGGISWGVTKFIDGGRKEFLWTLGIMIAVRFAYSAIEFVIGIIVWRVYGRRTMVNHFLTVMREGKLPMRVFCTDDTGNYFSRIMDPHDSYYGAGKITPEIQKVAAEMDRILSTVRDQHGMMAEVRTWDAMKRALEIHSPEDESPQYVSAYVRHWLHSNVTEAEIQILPNSSPELARKILAARPFETLTDLWRLLRNNGLDRMQAVLFLNGASTASDAWNEKRV